MMSESKTLSPQTHNPKRPKPFLTQTANAQPKRTETLSGPKTTLKESDTTEVDDVSTSFTSRQLLAEVAAQT